MRHGNEGALPSRLLGEDLDDVLRVDEHGLTFAEEKNDVQVFGGAKFPGLIEGIFGAIGEAHAKWPKGLAFDELSYLARFHDRRLHIHAGTVSRNSSSERIRSTIPGVLPRCV
jgi:hypothetical protein